LRVVFSKSRRDGRSVTRQSVVPADFSFIEICFQQWKRWAILAPSLRD
jgi:hypothetical protein